MKSFHCISLPGSTGLATMAADRTRESFDNFCWALKSSLVIISEALAIANSFTPTSGSDSDVWSFGIYLSSPC